MAEGDFRAAVHALYSSSGEARRAANQWLIEFARTPAAWAAAHTLVGEEREDMAYFGANMLYLKVRSEWHLLSDEARRAEYDRMWRTCTEGGSASASGPPGQVAKRLCLAVAAAAARTSGLAGQTAQLALSMLGAEGDGRAGVTLELLAALPLAVCEEEEATDGGSTGRAELLPLVPQLLAALEARATRSAEACLGCMRALQGWLALQAGVSLLALCSRHGPLLAAALHGLTAPDARPLNAAATDALTDLFSATNSPLSSAAPAEARGAVESLAAQFELMASQLGLSALASTRAEADDRVLGFCRVLAAFAERAVDVVAVTHGPLLCLVELMLLCAGAELRLAELTVDFWAGLQDTPVVERHESLRAPLYRRLAQVWLGQCTLPSSFVSWDEEPSVEEEDFSRFREQAALEVLESCLGLLGAEMATMLRTALDSSRSSWQTLEVTLFAMRGLHVPIKAAVRDGAGPRAESSVALQHLLSFVFAQLSTWHPPGHPSPLVESACRLIGAYGKWLAGEESLLRGCLRVVLESLESTAAAPHAAEAFRALCIHGRGVLARPAVLTELVGACAPLLASETLEPELCLTMQGARRDSTCRPYPPINAGGRLCSHPMPSHGLALSQPPVPRTRSSRRPALPTPLLTPARPLLQRDWHGWSGPPSRRQTRRRYSTRSSGSHANAWTSYSTKAGPRRPRPPRRRRSSTPRWPPRWRCSSACSPRLSATAIASPRCRAPSTPSWVYCSCAGRCCRRRRCAAHRRCCSAYTMCTAGR